MAYTVRKTTSYGQRVGNSGKKIGTGFLLLIVGTVLLFWNEGRTVKTTRMLKAAQKECVHLPDPSAVDPEFEGKMVHANGFATTDDILQDSYFGVYTNAIKLIREAEFYQWVEESHTETHDKLGGGQEEVTTYTYKKEWVSSPVNSDSFEDPSYRGLNSVKLDVDDNTEITKNVSFGAYKLPANLISQMHNEVPFEIEGVAEFAINQVAAEQPEYYHIKGNVAYVGKNPNVAEIGDVRITFTKVMPADVSILSKVVGNTFEPYVHKNGYSLSTLTEGTESMEAMFATEHSSNKAIAWLLRILGIILVFSGFKNIFEILTTLLKVVPFLASIMNLGVSLICGILTFVWCLVVIAIAWIWYRPLLGILLLACAGCAIWYFAKKGKEKGPAPEEAPAAAPAGEPKEAQQ